MYLLNLTRQLQTALKKVSPELRERQTAYLLRCQNPDGGFSGREGGSDLYYTGFALRGLALLEALSPAVAEKAGGFLRERMTQPASVVDFYSLLYAALLVGMAGGPDLFATSPPDWPDRVAAVLETFATADGGYAKGTGSVSGSTYHTFLVGLCYELLGRPFPRPDAVLRFIEGRRRDDGGFVELAPMRRCGTNPTAAAVGVIQMIQGKDFQPASLTHVVDFLAELPSDEGGLRANSRVPLADLLSTFTGCWTLAQLEALDRIDTAAGALSYAEEQEDADGGFRGGIWDDRADVEYTFYGLGVLALLTP